MENNISSNSCAPLSDNVMLQHAAIDVTGGHILECDFTVIDVIKELEISRNHLNDKCAEIEQQYKSWLCNNNEAGESTSLHAN